MNPHQKPGQQGPADGPTNNPGNKPGEPPKPGAPVPPNAVSAGEGRPTPVRGPVGPSSSSSSSDGGYAERHPNKDVGAILRGWEYEPGTINVRKIAGADGRPKLQMRLDLGLLQMEMTGRPDGRRPFGCESLLDHHEKRLADHRDATGGDDGFELGGKECQALREEAAMYYQRYLSLFVLEEFAGVVRDTARNLRLLDLCNKFAADEDDQVQMEQYRPYITMMNARARASVSFREKRYREALREIDRGTELIRAFFERFGQPEAFESANEVKVLKRFAREVRRKLPVDPVRKLEKRLAKAVKEERYEDAAGLRDKLALLKGEAGGPPSAQG